MTDRSRYVSPFTGRWASEEMIAIFSEDEKFRTWRKLWIALAESEQTLGLGITNEQIDELKAHADDINYDDAVRFEKEIRHDVMAHVLAYGDVCPNARGIIHLGATSCYVTDNADILMLRDAIALIRKKLIDALGGRFKEIIIGGAAMNPEVEEFFHKIKFPFTIGYGMTECGPLISYAPWDKFVPSSSGKILDIMEARIYKENPEAETGEIQVRGENVMTGYYKNPEATQEVFTKDGWLRTGDLGTMDDEGNIFIRGRLKTMILSSSGQNIFPEEIEAKLNNLPFILESLVIERNKKLVALVYADYEALDSLGLNHEDNLKTIMDENLKNLNNNVAAYEKVSQIQLYPTEFEKTPKRSIKRYLYNSIAED